MPMRYRLRTSGAESISSSALRALINVAMAAARAALRSGKLSAKPVQLN